ncbi:MAG: tetratricopeptide repeat protein [Chlamydiota bacterium]
MLSRRNLRCFFRGYLCLVLLILFLVAFSARATADNDSGAYDSAANQLLTQERLPPLEIFLEDHPNTRLKKDALELLLYGYQQAGRLGKVTWAAHQLLGVDPSNALALAVMAESAQEMSQMPPQRPEDLKQARAVATRGLLALHSFSAPRGADASLFENMKAQAKCTLDSVLGEAALRSKDYLTAQAHLRDAVEVTPNDVNRLHSLARAYLLADPPNHSQGMWFLARVTNLAGGSQLGRQANSYGRELSQKLYHSGSRWQELLQETRLNSMPGSSGSTPDAPTEDESPATPPASSAANGLIANSADSSTHDKNVLLNLRVTLLDATQQSRSVSNVEILLRRLDNGREPYLGPVLTDKFGRAALPLPAGRYELVTPHGVSWGQKWLTWNLEVPASDPQNYIQLTDENATDVDSRQQDRGPSTTAPLKNTVFPNANSSPQAERPLRRYSAVIVKKFLVEEDKDTAEFRGGDELLLQELIVGRMRKFTSFKSVVDSREGQPQAAGAGGSDPAARLTLAGTVVEYKTGGRIRRNVLGMVGGVMNLTVRFVFRDAQTGEEVFSTDLTGVGGPVFFGGNTEEMYTQAMLRLADSFIKVVDHNR